MHNVDVASMVCDLLDEAAARKVSARADHLRGRSARARYALDARKLRGELG